MWGLGIVVKLFPELRKSLFINSVAIFKTDFVIREGKTCVALFWLWLV